LIKVFILNWECVIDYPTEPMSVYQYCCPVMLQYYKLNYALSTAVNLVYLVWLASLAMQIVQTVFHVVDVHWIGCQLTWQWCDWSFAFPRQCNALECWCPLYWLPIGLAVIWLVLCWTPRHCTLVWCPVSTISTKFNVNRREFLIAPNWWQM